MKHVKIIGHIALCTAALGAVFSAGCAATSADIVRVFSTIKPSTDPTYGYTLENPVLVGEFGSGASASFAASHYFIAGLRKNGRPLKVLSRSLVTDMTDEWLTVPKGTTDTVVLYVNLYRSGEIRLPQGLTFDPPPPPHVR